MLVTSAFRRTEWTARDGPNCNTEVVSTAPAIPAARLLTLVGPLGGNRSGPLYVALADRIRLLIGDGRIPVGVRLPAERHLAAYADLSRATVTSAYQRLRETGWASARQGAGTWTRLPARSDAAQPGSWVPAPPGSGVLDLAHAAPSAPPQLAAAYAAALVELPRYLPDHGYHPAGLPELRARIADRYTARGLPTSPEHVLVTGGALHGIAVAFDALVGRGDRVLVEHPSYPNALDAISRLQAQAVPVAITDEGPRALVDDVFRTARQSAPRAAYLIPDFQNPTGIVVEPEERGRLAASLRQLGVVTVIDETLAELALDGDPRPPYAAFAGPEEVVSVGTLSKIAWGGLGIGWLRADPSLLSTLASTAARGRLAEPVVDQLAACYLLDHVDELLGQRRQALRAQRDVLVAGLGRALPSWEVPVPTGGQVVWCRLPYAMSSAIAAAAPAHGMALAAGPRFGTGHAFDDRLRLPFTHSADVIEQGVKILAAIVSELPAERGGQPRDSSYVV
jgi:DNA-binding transcriptional MocR family regulator